jgi:hypothetical protein
MNWFSEKKRIADEKLAQEKAAKEQGRTFS